MKLTHPFLRRCIDPSGLFVGPSGKRSYKLTTFLSRLRKQSIIYAQGDNDEEQAYKGDGFELFCEYMIRCMGMDKRIGVAPDSYVPEDASLDYGVDGYGTALDTKPITVQCKCYVADTTLQYNKAHLGNFRGESFSTKYGVDPTPGPDGKCNLLVITSCKGFHHTVKKIIPEARCLNIEQLRVLVDDNKLFWIDFESAWMSALQSARRWVSR